MNLPEQVQRLEDELRGIGHALGLLEESSQGVGFADGRPTSDAMIAAIKRLRAPGTRANYEGELNAIAAALGHTAPEGEAFERPSGVVLAAEIRHHVEWASSLQSDLMAVAGALGVLERSDANPDAYKRPSIDKLLAEIEHWTKREPATKSLSLLSNELERSEQRAASLENELRMIADHLGLVNQGEGTSGYERADAPRMVAAIKGMQALGELAPTQPAPALIPELDNQLGPRLRKVFGLEADVDLEAYATNLLVQLEAGARHVETIRKLEGELHKIRELLGLKPRDVRLIPGYDPPAPAPDLYKVIADRCSGAELRAALSLIATALEMWKPESQEPLPTAREIADTINRLLDETPMPVGRCQVTEYIVPTVKERAAFDVLRKYYRRDVVNERESGEREDATIEAVCFFDRLMRTAPKDPPRDERGGLEAIAVALRLWKPAPAPLPTVELMVIQIEALMRSAMDGPRPVDVANPTHRMGETLRWLCAELARSGSLDDATRRTFARAHSYLTSGEWPLGGP